MSSNSVQIIHLYIVPNEARFRPCEALVSNGQFLSWEK